MKDFSPKTNADRFLFWNRKVFIWLMNPEYFMNRPHIERTTFKRSSGKPPDMLRRQRRILVTIRKRHSDIIRKLLIGPTNAQGSVMKLGAGSLVPASKKQ
jgi:hypothetical protein